MHYKHTWLVSLKKSVGNLTCNTPLLINTYIKYGNISWLDGLSLYKCLRIENRYSIKSPPLFRKPSVNAIVSMYAQVYGVQLPHTLTATDFKCSKYTNPNTFTYLSISNSTCSNNLTSYTLYINVVSNGSTVHDGCYKFYIPIILHNKIYASLYYIDDSYDVYTPNTALASFEEIWPQIKNYIQQRVIVTGDPSRVTCKTIFKALLAHTSVNYKAIRYIHMNSESSVDESYQRFTDAYLTQKYNLITANNAPSYYQHVGLTIALYLAQASNKQHTKHYFKHYFVPKPYFFSENNL
ncbi:MAG: hypothetical protein ABL940_13030 [Bacteroidia bacterium]